MATPSLRNSDATPITVATLVRRRFQEKKADCLEFSTLGAAGITLATAKTLTLKEELPVNAAKGVCFQTIELLIPYANRADGSRRFTKFVTHISTPGDATPAELLEIANNAYDMFYGSGSIYVSFLQNRALKDN
jgi:hypothetical protein